MPAINTSISYQSQFAPANLNLSDFRTKRSVQAQIEVTKETSLKPPSPKYSVQSVMLLGELGKHVNLKV